MLELDREKTEMVVHERDVCLFLDEDVIFCSKREEFSLVRFTKEHEITWGRFPTSGDAKELQLQLVRDASRVGMDEAMYSGKFFPIEQQVADYFHRVMNKVLGLD